MNVIGAVFTIMILTTALNMTIWLTRQQSEVMQLTLQKQNEDINTLKENIKVSSVNLANNKLNMTITNEGTSKSTIKSLYLVNETSQQNYVYNVDMPLEGKNVTTNLGQLNPSLPLTTNNKYTVKIVSESGNTATARIKPISLSQVKLPLSLYVLPSTVTTLENVTLLFAVMNNLTEGDHLSGSVTPVLQKSLSCGSGQNCGYTDYISPQPAVISNGAVVFFKWVFAVKAPAGTTMTFNATLQGAKQGNYVIETGRVEIVQEALISNQVIVSSQASIRPDVYMLSPGPFGTSNQKAVWGVVVVNPTASNIKVKMIAINLFSSSTSSNAHIMTPSGCNVAGLKPGASDWSCPHDGILMWQNLDSPITVKGNSSYAFLAKTVPGSLPNGAAEAAFMISIVVFTDMGQFSRQGYASNMYDSNTALANVYLTDTTTTTLANQDSHIFGNVTGIGNTNQTMYVALTDFDTSTSTQINSGATLIINVPKEIKNVYIPGLNGYPGSQSGFTSPQIVNYTDGSRQIRVTTNQAIGDTSTEAQVFKFVLELPSSTNKVTYALHTFIAGKVNTANPFASDAFGTLALTACPNSGCT